MARPEQFVQTFVEKLLAYSLGRSTEWYDMPAVREIVRRSAADDYRFSAVVMGIVQSVPFTTRDAGAGESPELSATTTDGRRRGGGVDQEAYFQTGGSARRRCVDRAPASRCHDPSRCRTGQTP